MILKTRDFSLPVMVKVFAFSSAAEITPWKGTARSVEFFSAGGADLVETATAVAILGADEGDVFAAAAATAGEDRAETAR